MTANQEKIKKLFLEYLETVEDTSIDKEALKNNAYKVISALTPAAAKNILESDKAQQPLQEADPIEERSPEEVNRIILNYLLEAEDSQGIPLLYRPITAGSKGQTVAKSIIELVDYGLAMLNAELRPIFEAEQRKTEQERQANKENIKKLIFEKYHSIIKRLITLLWDKEAAGSVEDTDIFTPETLISVIPKESFILNDKVNKLLPIIDVDGQEQPLIVSGKKAKKELTTTILLSYAGDNLELKGGKSWTAYDRAVHNAVISLWEAGNTYFTPEMVYRAMNGITADDYISPTAVADVEASIEKSRVIKAVIKCSDVSAAYKKKNTATLDAFLLEVRKATVKAGGTTKAAYCFISQAKPILYEYSQISGEILAFSPKLLQTKKAVNSTADVIVIREYLIRRIEEMKSPRKTAYRQNHKIKYAAIYSLLSKEELTKDKQKKTKSHIEKLLKYYVGTKYIKGYEEYTIGRRKEGVIIDV